MSLLPVAPKKITVFTVHGHSRYDHMDGAVIITGLRKSIL